MIADQLLLITTVNIKDVHVFTDADLDGAISYLVLCWYFGCELPVTVTTEKDFEKELDSFLRNNNPDSFRRVYVLDMDICSCAAKVDRGNFTIVDHHQGSINCGHNFKNARFRIKDEGSTCKLLYGVMKEHYKRDLLPAQKLMVAIGHDYDSYSLKDKEKAIGLNTLFWNYQGNRLQKFIKRYYNGFENFTEEDKRIIAFYRNKIDRYINENAVYIADLPIKNRVVKASSIFADFCINEIAQAIIDKTGSEIGVVVNLKTGNVSFRRAKGSEINVAKLAEKIAKGGGHEAAAGGILTDTFAEFTKLFKMHDQ